jgi:drug/metabolite transporter (DMT)-like permease
VGTVGIWLSVLLLAPTERADLHGFLYFALAGIVGTTGGRLFRFMSIERVGASVSSALINLYPSWRPGSPSSFSGKR